MNMLAARIDLASNVARLSDGSSFPLPQGTRATDGQEVIYGIRPDQWIFSTGDQGATAMVELIEPTGAEILLAAQLGGQRILCAFRERHALKPGDAIRLAVDTAAAHVFDRQTEQRISP